MTRTVSYESEDSALTRTVLCSRLTSNESIPFQLALEPERLSTCKLTADSLQGIFKGAGTATAAHLDIELVLVGRHGIAKSGWEEAGE